MTVRDLAVFSLLAAGFELSLAAEPPDQARPKPAQPKVDQALVDSAIKKGIEYLRSKGEEASRNPDARDCAAELVLWTLIHADVSPNDPEYMRLLKIVLASENKFTYRTSLKAMILEEIDRVKFQKEIWKCAQFLVDNMDEKGQWGYGEPTTYKDLPQIPANIATKATASAKPKIKKSSGSSPGASGFREKPAVVQTIPVHQQRSGACYDNSNTQYAALGLRACFDAGIVFDKAVIDKARRWLYECVSDAAKSKGVVVTGMESAAGWGYGRGGSKTADPYGSMTAGAAGSLAIYASILREDPRKDVGVLKGLHWMSQNFTATRNPGVVDNMSRRPGTWHYYYLYAVERLGEFCRTDFFGKHAWYVEGAQYLLKEQSQDGSWKSSDDGHSVWDTCWAILFLKRATRPLEIPTEDSRAGAPRPPRGGDDEPVVVEPLPEKK